MKNKNFSIFNQIEKRISATVIKLDKMDPKFKKVLLEDALADKDIQVEQIKSITKDKYGYTVTLNHKKYDRIQMLTDKGAEEEFYERQKDLIDDIGLEAFNKSFVTNDKYIKDVFYTDMSKDLETEIESYSDLEDLLGDKEAFMALNENYQKYVDTDKVINDVENIDGRGGTLASYDGEENQSNGIYFYFN